MRDDIGDKLVHLSRGTSGDATQQRGQAAKNLNAILRSGKLVGGTGFIKGGYTCVCFSEAPIAKLSHLLAAHNPDGYKYQPYGLMVDKRWVYEAGGRPAIYGPEQDFFDLPEAFKYRHVRFELTTTPTIDLTWEREWRLHAPELLITPADVTVVVPSRHAKETFEKYLDKKWHFIVLSDLGVKISAL